MARSKLITGSMLFALAILVAGAPLRGQVGPSLGVMDANVAPEAELLKMPHMTPAIVTGLIAKRNFNSVVDLNAYLLGSGLTQAQAMEFYQRAFIHVNLNTAPRAELVLVPNAGTRMAHEFEEYRPWKSFAQFDKEIGKYVPQEAVQKFKQYTFIPIDLNTATDEQILSIPGIGKRMVHEFKEYRPWKTKAQFEKEIGKYVSQQEVARLWRYVVIN